MAQALPVVLCGRSPQIAAAVKELAKPEFEVIHVILTPELGVANLPNLFHGKAPPEDDADNVGTKDYSRPPKALIAGGGYEDDDIERMWEACKGVNNIPWFRPDMTKPKPPLGPGYGEHMVGRVKEKFAELQKEGKLDGAAVHFY